MDEAFRLYTRYFEYRQNNKNLFKKFEASEAGIKDALLDGLPGVLPGTDHRGRRIIVLYSANWDNTRYGLAAIYRAILLTLEKLIDEESCQINGFVVIVDWSEFTFKQSSWLNPRVLKLMIEGLQVGCVSVCVCLCTFVYMCVCVCVCVLRMYIVCMFQE